MAERDLNGARVLITGASSGVGLAAARVFAREGADVAVLARGEEGLEQAASTARGHGARTLVLRADITDRAAVDAAVATVVREWGGIDVLVSNAAGMVYGPFDQVSPEDFERTVQVTFLGAVNVIRAALPVLERSAGTIVVTSSVNSRAPLPGFSSYAASKHALRGFCRTLRIELMAQRSPVRIAMLLPGAIDTPIWRNVTSATGRLPRAPPEGYTAEAVAEGLVALARSPRPEAFFALEGRLFHLIWTRFGPLSDLVLRIVFHFYESGRKPGTGADVLWSPGIGAREGGVPLGRPSLTAALRMRGHPRRRRRRRP